jgi:tetratricopeptide (TPR) repeat protein
MNLTKYVPKLRELIAGARLAEARNLCLDLVMAHPRNTDVWMLRVDVHYKRGEFNDAIECCHKILAYDPGNIKAHIARATLSLLHGDFEAGWSEYEWRLRHPDMIVPPTGRPRWRGEPLAGKTIMVLCEQGLGDTIQFVRYVRILKSLGAAKIFLLCQPELKRLLEGFNGIDAFFKDGDSAPPYDFEIPMMSFPLVLKTTLDTIPGGVPYLSAKEGTGTKVIMEIARHPNKLRAGLVWAGGKINPNDSFRSCGLAPFHELLVNRGVTFFSLQKGEASCELTALKEANIIDIALLLEDFADTAMAIQELDLVISVDTAVAHLAGALGKTVWTLIPYAPDWRWMLDREDSPWYPTMRLFRQSAPGDWASVIERVSEELKALVEAE